MKKNSILFFLLCLITFKSFSQDSISYPLRATLKIVKAGYYPFKELGMDYYQIQDLNSAFEYGKVYKVELDITNVGNKTAYLIMMTCSWEENLLFSNDFIWGTGRACDSNYPTIIELNHGETKAYSTTLTLNPKYNYTYVRLLYSKQIETTKLAIIVANNIYDWRKDSYLGKRQYASYNDYLKNKSNWKDVIWSNPINLK